MSEKIHASSKEYSVDVLPSFLGDESAASIRPIDPKILRRASLKIDLYIIPIIGMFREPYFLVYTPFSCFSPLPLQDLLSYLVSVDMVPHGRTFKQSRHSRVDRMLLHFHFSSYLKNKRNIGNARIAGLTTSLHMSSKQFSIALTIT